MKETVPLSRLPKSIPSELKDAQLSRPAWEARHVCLSDFESVSCIVQRQSSFVVVVLFLFFVLGEKEEHEEEEKKKKQEEQEEEERKDKA